MCPPGSIKADRYKFLFACNKCPAVSRRSFYVVDQLKLILYRVKLQSKIRLNAFHVQAPLLSTPWRWAATVPTVFQGQAQASEEVHWQVLLATSVQATSIAAARPQIPGNTLAVPIPSWFTTTQQTYVSAQLLIDSPTTFAFPPWTTIPCSSTFRTNWSSKSSTIM